MSDDVQPPIVITDKREQKRLEAAERARRLAEEAEHPSAEGTEPAAETILRLEGATETEQAMARIDRIQQLQEKGRQIGVTLTEEERGELLTLQAEEDEAHQEQKRAAENVTEALTAFLVIVGHDGSARATSDVNMDLVIDREATVDDMFGGSSIVIRDINAAMASKHTVFGLNVSAQAMQEKAMATRLLQQQGGVPAGRRR